MNEMGDALRSCMEQLLHTREEKERLIIEATNTISSEQKRTRDLQHKLEDLNNRFDKLIVENRNLRNTVDSKEKLIKELVESKAYSDQKVTDVTSRLEFSQKQGSSLKYEVRMLQEELKIRNKEREYDLKSLSAAQKQHQASMKKITILEAECQRLRTMVQKRLPGPAALAKMKDEVKRQGTGSVDNGVTKSRARARHPVPEDYLVKLQELGDENKHLKRSLVMKESDLQFLNMKYVDEACKLSALQRHLKESSGQHDLTENSHSEPRISGKLEHSRSQRQRVSQSMSGRISSPGMQFLVDPLEIEKLEIASRPSSAPHQCGSDVPHTYPEMGSEAANKAAVSDDASSDKYLGWVQDVLKVILSKHHVTKISVADILDEVRHALSSEFSAKGTGVAHLSSDKSQIDKMIATLIERVRCMIKKSTESNSKSFQSGLHEKSELIFRLERLIHVCNDILDGKANHARFIDEVCLILEWMVNQCFFCLNGLGTVNYITNNLDGNKSLTTVHEEYTMQSGKSEMSLGMYQESQKEPIEKTKGQIHDDISENHSQIQLVISTFDEELLSVTQEQGDNCQEKHSVYYEAECAVSDGTKEKLQVEEEKQLITSSAISAAAKKLAECQETILSLSKQLDSLQSPADADASDKEKCYTLPLSVHSVANLVAEAGTKLVDFSPPTYEEVAWKKEPSEPDAFEKSPEHGQDSGIGPKTDKSGPTPIIVRPKSPRTSISVDARKKKRRAGLLSRLVFRKKA